MAELRDCRTLPDLVRRQVRLRADATAIVFEGSSTTYGELDRHARQVGNALLGLGVGPGARVAYLGKNTDRFFELLFGAASIGAVLVPVNWRLAAPEIEGVLADAAIAALFVGPGYGPIAADLALPGDAPRISLDDAQADWPDYAEWRDSASALDPAAAIGPEDTAVQLYTSGTTGLPKGVELTGRNLVAFLEAAREGGWGDVVADDVFLVCMPLFHAAGLLAGLVGLAHGAKIVLLAEVDVTGIFDAVPLHGVTWTVLVPAVILLVVQHPRAAKADFASIRKLVYGASPIAEDLVRRAGALFRNAGLWHLYGLTEATAAGTISPPEAHDPSGGKLRSCGRPYPGLELRIVDPAGSDVRQGDVGEIVLRGPTVMKGYWNNLEATCATFFEGGWLRTGDAAYVDTDGFVYVHDRVKDMIVTGGENVYPAEVENGLFGHPAIADVAVIGVPDPRWGEAVKAVVVLREGLAATADDIIAYGRSRIAGYKLPKSVDFVDCLPRNPTGKVLKRELRARYWAGHGRQVS